jgi:deoxyadenosine/deoxycytidine kinase
MFSKSDIMEILQRFVSSDLVDDSNPLKIHTVDNAAREEENKMPYVVSLEGNIGAGKSTLLEKMRQIYLRKDGESEKYFGKLAASKILFMPEPVDIWTSVCDSETGESILEKFYKDPKQYAFAFQVMVYNTHLEAFRKVVRENPDCVLLICERSIDAGRHIFAEMLYDDGMIDNVCFKVYKNLYSSTVNEFPLDAILHLDVEPTICLERIGKRAREGEAGIPLEYLEKCDIYYRKWFANLYSTYKTDV